MKVTPGSVNVTTYFALSLLADGSDATALTITDIDLQYVRSGAAPAAKADATALAATDSAHSDNAAIEIDATDQPGLYRVDWPDAAFAAGVPEVVLTVKCALVKTQHLRVELETLQTGDTYALANGASGFVAIIADTNELQTDWTNGGRLDLLIDAIKAKTDSLTFTVANVLDANTLRVGGTVQTAGDIIAQIDLISIATNAGDLASKTADAGDIVSATGTTISGTFSDTASDDNTYWITAPVTPAVDGFGLRQNLRFDLELGRVPTQLEIKGYWNGGGQTADIYALNARTGVYDKLTNAGTNLLSRNSEFTYAITIPRDYADDSGGVNNIVTIEIRSTSTNTGHRMRIDRALIYHVDEAAVFTITTPTAEQIWTYINRTLTTPGEEPSSLTFTVEGIVDANVRYVNSVEVDGDGEPGTEWGPVP